MSEDDVLHSSRIFNRHKEITNNNESSMLPLLDLGKESSHISSKTTPIHSDDEVTPRRGLDEMMSSRKLLDLDLEL